MGETSLDLEQYISAYTGELSPTYLARLSPVPGYTHCSLVAFALSGRGVDCYVAPDWDVAPL